MVELALPAGTIAEALAAFRAGADAVYFGMKEFSARSGAGNFSEEDLSAIRRYALEHGKRIYVAVNTLIDDSDLERAFSLLSTIARYGTDGILVQDLGIARLARKYFPSLPLHASTQLAVHTSAGVKALQSLGFERVVLSRELDIDEIRKIRKDCPDIEIKAFIHGALCYGFSGLCMASHLITGRSANEGSCAQICRTWFRDEASGKRLYPFSLKDLDSGRLVKELVDAGIDSLKVEGRLKGPEYVDAVARYYRAIIDGEDESLYKKAVALSFQRSSGPGYLRPLKKERESLVTSSYTVHIGMEIGRAIDQRGRKLLVETKDRIKNHDGLMLLLDDGDLSKPYRFSANVKEMLGERAILILPDDTRIESGTTLYMISDSSMNMKRINTNLPLMKRSIEACITLGKESLEIETPAMKKSYSITIEESEKDAVPEIERILSQSGDSPFTLSPIKIANNTGLKRFYINPSLLKRIRRDFLSSLPEEDEEKRYEAAITEEASSILPDRKLLDGERTPWNTDGKEIGGSFYISFPAVRYDEEAVFEKMEMMIAKHPDAIIGLNNIGDLQFAKKHPEIRYFADIYLYVANREAAALLKEEIPSLIGGYLWLERDQYIEPWPWKPTITGYHPPLFISRSCYRHDSLGLSCKGCTMHNTFHIEQNGKEYLVLADDCTTIVKED